MAHLFCVDGALHLEGHTPTEAQTLPNQRSEIVMAAEVPFVKPTWSGSRSPENENASNGSFSPV